MHDEHTLPDDPRASPTSDLPPHVPEEPPATPRPKRIGDCQIRRVIASGGMGTVYEAMQEKPRRPVAVKVMKHGVTSRSALRRFEYESQILARLRHPGIAQVYEAGTYDEGEGGVPYFVMEYIPNGRPLVRYANAMRLGTRERVALFALVCDAVHHGHQRGIIHRDLKPDNILVDSSGQPKVIDFGVARATDSDMAVTTLQTDVGQLVGTVQYMSPEQVEADPHDIDTRSDVYTLGVVLYELLTGALPYDARDRSVYEAVRLVREQPPSRPSTVDRSLRGDLETIVLKTLEKDRSRRYQSAGELRQDLERYLDGAPITARPPSVSYQLHIFARKNRALVATAALVVLALVAGTIGTTLGMIRAQRGMTAARDSERSAERERARAAAVSDFLTRTLASANPFLPGRASSVALHGEVSATYAGETGREIAAVDLLLRAAETLDVSFGDAPDTRADLHHTLGETLLGLGQIDEARTQLERAVELRARLHGAGAPDTARSRRRLAEALAAEGRGDRADRMFAEAHAALAASQGEADEETLAAATGRADALLHRGHLAEAADLQRRALETAERVLGPDDPVTLDQMVRLCRLRWVATDLDDAIDVGQRAVSGLERVAGTNAQATADAMYELSGPLRSAGRFEEAYEMGVAALAMTRRNLGPEHPRTLACMRNLGNVEQMRERYDESEAMFSEALAIERRLLAPTDLELLLTLNDYAACLAFRGADLDRAEAMAREAWTGFEKVLGPETQYALNAADTLAMILREQGRPEESMELYQRIATTAERRRLQASVPIFAHLGLAWCLTDLGRYEEAETHLATAREHAGADVTMEELRAWHVASGYVELYEAWDRPEDAAAWRDAADDAPPPR